MRSPNRLIAYEHTCNHRYHLDWKGISVPWSRLELSRRPRLHRERHFFDAFPCSMGRVGASKGKRDPGVVLVLEHWWQRDHVFLLHFQTGSGRHPGLSAQLANLHPQLNAYPETEVCPHRSRAVAKPARDQITVTQVPRAHLTIPLTPVCFCISIELSSSRRLDLRGN